jgi:hypothetical protein
MLGYCYNLQRIYAELRWHHSCSSYVGSLRGRVITWNGGTLPFLNILLLTFLPDVVLEYYLQTTRASITVSVDVLSAERHSVNGILQSGHFLRFWYSIRAS